MISSDTKLGEILRFCLEGWGYEVFFWEKALEDIELVKKILPEIIILDVHSAQSDDLKICSLLRKDFISANIPIIILINKRHLRSHLLNLKYGVDDYLIKPPDPLDLRVRIEMAIRRLQLSFWTNPLTGLPGANLLEEVVKSYLKEKRDFSFAYLDIDYFKYFNDRYGYRKGDGVILQVAYLLYRTIRQFGNNDDFLAHIGGDDFSFVSSPDKYETICQNFIFAFDRIIPFHYSSEDRQRRFILVRDRARNLKRFPLMSVSVAVVNVNRTSSIQSMLQINERLAEIKKYLKSLPGSKYMVDRRSSAFKDLGPFLHRQELSSSYKPIGQVLLEKNLFSLEQLEEALRIHWRKGIPLGEVMKELRLIEEKELVDALCRQENLLLGNCRKS